jgi:hypothetical protein
MSKRNSTRMTSLRAGARFAVLAAIAASAPAQAHEGTSEERAMRMLALIGTLDKTWAAQQAETDAARRDTLLAKHAQALLAMQEVLRDAADQSPCVLMEARDTARQTACLVDTEARLRATERVMWHVLNRVGIAGH